MLMTKTAADEFLDSASRLAGPMKSSSVDRLMSRIQIIPDTPSIRALGLRMTRSVGRNDTVLFGTGVFGAFDASVHDLFSLIGR